MTGIVAAADGGRSQQKPFVEACKLLTSLGNPSVEGGLVGNWPRNLRRRRSRSCDCGSEG